MTNADLYALMTETFPASERPWVCTALLQDSLLWQSMSEHELAVQAQQAFGSQSRQWSPGKLMRLLLSKQVKPETAQLLEAHQLSEHLENQSARALKHWLQNPAAEPKDAFVQAGLIGLALLRLSDQGQQIERVELVFKNTRRPTDRIWRTAAACLHEWVKEPWSWLNYWLSFPQGGVELVTQVFLSQPLPQAEQNSQLADWLAFCTNHDTRGRLANLFLPQLHQLRPALAADLAGWLAETWLPQPTEHAHPAWAKSLQDLEQLSQQAYWQQQDGRSFKALATIEALWQQTQALQGQAAALWARQALTNGMPQTGMETERLGRWHAAEKLNADNPLVQSICQSGLLLAHLNLQADQATLGLPTEIQQAADWAIALPEQSAPAWLKIHLQTKLACLAFMQGQNQNALRLAESAASQALSESSWSSSLAVLHELATVLLQMECPQQSLQVAEMALSLAPDSTAAVQVVGQAKMALGQAESAAAAYRTLLLLQPDHVQNRRELAQALEQAGLWSSAFAERQQICEQLANPGEIPPADLQALAVCALQSEQYLAALKSGEKILKKAPADPTAHRLCGQAYFKLQNYAAAGSHLQQAIESAPQPEDLWLQWIQALQANQSSAATLEALKMAVQTHPASARLQLELGEALLQNQSFSEASAVLQQAASLLESAAATDPDHSSLYPRVQYRLGCAWRQLGQLEQSRQALSESYRTTGAVAEDYKPEITAVYIQVLLALADYATACPILEAELAANPDQPDLQVHYGRSLLALGQAPAQAAAALKKALQFYPDNAEASALLAEAWLELDQVPDALQLFLEALESPLAQEGNWLGRLSLGLGRAALLCGQTETALAALQDAAHLHSDNPAVHRWLAQARWAADLPQHTWEAAMSALSVDPGTTSAFWLAEQAGTWLKNRTGNQAIEARQRLSAAVSSLLQPTQVLEKAIQVLESSQALQGAGQKLTTLAQLYLLNEQTQAAQQALERIWLVPNIQAQEWEQAAGLYQVLGRAEQAAASWREALSALEAAGGCPGLELWLSLAAAEERAGTPLQAIQSLERAAHCCPDQEKIYQRLIRLLIQVNKEEQALYWIEQALTQLTSKSAQAELHFSAARLLQQMDNPTTKHLLKAFNHATQAIKLQEHSLGARALAVSLARSLLLPESAVALIQPLLSAQPMPGRSDRTPEKKSSLNGYEISLRCDGAELALQNGLEIEAAQIATPALEQTAGSPQLSVRLLTLQARLMLREETHVSLPGDSQRNSTAAAKTLAEAFAQFQQLPAGETSVLHALAQAAAEFEQWEQVSSLLQQAAQQAPEEMRSQLALARWLTWLAEYAALCRDFVTQPPVLPDQAAKQFQKAIQSVWLAYEQAKNSNDAALAPLPDASVAEIRRWEYRGSLIFGLVSAPAQLESLWQSFEHTPTDVAAWLAAQRRCGADAQQATTAFITNDEAKNHPLVLLNIAWLYAANDLPFARRHAQAALEQSAGWVRPNFRLPGDSDPAVINPLFIQAVCLCLAAQLAWQAGSLEEALQAQQQALRLWPGQAQWHYQAADWLLAGAEERTALIEQKAFQHLEEALRIEPTHAEAAIALGRVMLQAGANEQRGLQRARRHLERSSKLLPNEAEIWLLLGEACLAGGGHSDMQSAAHCADQVLALSNARTRLSASARLLKARTALSSGNHDEAVRQARSAAQECRGQADTAQDCEVFEAAILLQAQALESSGRSPEALVVLDRASKSQAGLAAGKQPKSPALHIKRAALAAQVNGLPSALEGLQAASAEFPQEAQIQAALAEHLLAAGKPVEALEHAQLALQNAAVDSHALPQTTAGRMHLLVGRSLAANGHLDLAVTHLAQANRWLPAEVEVYLELAQAYQLQRMYLKAQATLEQAIQSNPQDTRPYLQAALAYKEGKDYEAAANMLQQAADRLPKNSDIRKQLAALMTIVVLNRESANPSSRSDNANNYANR